MAVQLGFELCPAEVQPVGQLVDGGPVGPQPGAH